MVETDGHTVLDRLLSTGEREDWVRFLQTYSPLIFQVVRLFENDDDSISDCFVFVSEQLKRDRFRRLRKFKNTGTASFTTWLRVVVRNLYLDWRRKQSGRPRPFRSITRLSGLDQEVYRCVFGRGMTAQETLHSLQYLFPTLTPDQVDTSLERIGRTLSSRQRWLLSSRKARFESISTDSKESRPATDLPSPDADPQAIATNRQLLKKLNQSISRLSPADRLLVRLRFEQDLSLERVAKIAGLTDGRMADRRIKEILKRLRDHMDSVDPDRRS